MPPCPCLAQTPPNALMLQPQAMRPSLPSVLALLWDTYQRMTLSPCNVCEHTRSFSLTLQTPFSSHDDHPDDPKTESEATPVLGWSFRIHGVKKGLEEVWEVTPMPPPPKIITAAQSGLDQVLPHLHPVLTSVAPGRGRRYPHLREARLILAC